MARGQTKSSQGHTDTGEISEKGFPDPCVKGLAGKGGLVYARAFTLHRADAPGYAEEAINNSLGWLVPPVCCLPAHHSF